ncbi:HK97 gp10 family phage protein [Rhizobium sp. SG_E_25_P2]|uniref:HK97-gp10 family putative phage morphogenesis protein n=1 Tax=Rhizobium sp. SG_E_25_P2 TaxID=2879942 RepID=UPI00247351E7|nr:HK97-gp10 family putative phage morphogenesis protein [Rhizobium sp. SG_E_25_P2]MDH6265642.1 HK97 gp10 family phage protein [Rhizobium sp. SG_E_25_P2]
MSSNKTLTEQSRDLERRLNAVPAQILAALRPALIRSANEVAANARALAPKDTGELVDSIAVTGPGETTPAYAAQGGQRTAGPNQALVTVGDAYVRYAHMLEFGTVKMEAQPFLRPSWRLARTRILNRLTRTINAVTKKLNPK